ncbi:S-adenosyl-L-methionine-dependent methyltransferase [Podospora fimiseda]|uniref:S-adenosyl-L-methionine-dependent methyltransferase n=1 Tax=Podospora fimiseda TaxID=252190 RepID=A0AAN7BN72_9PEZI|nr:S-adenosyl-L-methionine-dependent methyltransferase [Podospora fimiseda]
MASSTHTPSALPSDSATQDVAKLAAAAEAQQAAESVESAEAEAYERTHVHGVYEAIAPHFSATRYKPWPAVASFLSSQNPGAVGFDVGCGNGKYLGVNPSLFMVGSDRSESLVALAEKRGRQLLQEGKRNVDQDRTNPAGGEGTGGAAVGIATEVVVADGLSLPFRERSADFVICVAVVHHMSTRSRRQEAIRQLLRCVKLGGNDHADGGGQVLVYVWALEQGSSRRGWEEGGEQDLLVPWVLKSGQKKPKAEKMPQDAPSKGGEAETATPAADPVFKRYYHLYRKGELEEDILAAGGVVVTSGYEKDNWWVVATNEPPSSSSRPR